MILLSQRVAKCTFTYAKPDRWVVILYIYRTTNESVHLDRGTV